MLSWQWPWFFLMLPLPWLLRYLLPQAGRQQQAIRVPFYQQFSEQPQRKPASGQQKVFYLLAILGWLALLAAACRPVLFGAPVTVATSGRDLMLAIDISDSMRIDDMRNVDSGDSQSEENYTTRLSAIKRIASEFVERRQSDRVGLILFGQRSYLQTPLTFDRNTVVVQLNEALAGFAGSSTSIGDAIGLAITTLRDRPAESRVLVLLTDGANTSGSEPLEAMDIALDAGIRIHTIGVGAGPRLVTDGVGRKRKIDRSKDLDEVTLQTIADATGGQYFRAHDPQEMLEIYRTIDQLEPAPEEKTLRPQRSLYHWPLALSLLLFGFLLALRTMRLQ